MKQINLDEVEDVKEFERLTLGGYICRILDVKDNTEKEYLEIKFDISEGKFKGYFGSQQVTWGKWSPSGRIIRSYKEKALPFFKKLIKDIEASNPGFTFNNDEKALINLQIGVVFGQEEYLSGDEVKIAVKPQFTRTISQIKEGLFTIPVVKKLAEEEESESVTNFVPLDDDNLPF